VGSASLRFKAALFDLDGVLVDSYECWYQLLNDTLRKQGKSPISRTEFDSRWGQGPEADREAFFPEWSLPDLVAFYNDQFPKYLSFPKQEPVSVELFTFLRSEDKRVGIASNSPTKVVRDLLAQASLDSLPDIIVGVDQVREGKPAPDLLLKAVDLFHLDRGEVCYVGDSRFDAEAAEAAGIFFIGYKRPGDLSVKSLDELTRWFREI
jgi:HAD superfamily hydrolase (TIGR01509 family)